MTLDYRYEIKFVLDDTKLSDAMQWLYSDTTTNKTYSDRRVNSIYFDDVDFSSVKDNLAGMPQRNKLRLRWYGLQENSLPYFEVKTKNARTGYKTSYPIKSIENNLLEISVEKITSKCTKDLAKQDIVFDKHLVPTLQVNYERGYYETHDSIRITIDQDIKFSDTQLHTRLNENSSLSYPLNVMEIKFKPSMKESVAELIRPLHMTPKRHSKYLVGLAKLGYVVYI